MANHRAILLTLVTMLLSCATTFDDGQFDGYADLCFRNLTQLDQLSKALENISPNVMDICLCRNDLTHLESNTFIAHSSLEKLVLSRNRHFDFPADGSPMLSLSSLTDFVCELCGVVKIFNRSLRKLPRLEYLELPNNAILQIEKRAFQENRHLKCLDLSGNLLRWIPSTVLLGLQEMDTVNLSFNRELAPVGHKPFLKSHTLEKMKCNGCGFTVIYDTTFAELPNLEEIQLQDNPLFRIQQSVTLQAAMGLVVRFSSSRLRSRDGETTNQTQQPAVVLYKHQR